MRGNQKKSHSDFHMIQGLAEGAATTIPNWEKQKKENWKDQKREQAWSVPEMSFWRFFTTFGSNAFAVLISYI